jgi:hypothetical protein
MGKHSALLLFKDNFSPWFPSLLLMKQVFNHPASFIKREH